MHLFLYACAKNKLPHPFLQWYNVLSEDMFPRIWDDVNVSQLI